MNVCQQRVAVFKCRQYCVDKRLPIPCPYINHHTNDRIITRNKKKTFAIYKMSWTVTIFCEHRNNAIIIMIISCLLATVYSGKLIDILL